MAYKNPNYQKEYQRRYQQARSQRFRVVDSHIVEPAMTFEEIGQVLGLSKAFVARIYAGAIYKMKIAAGVIREPEHPVV